MIIYAPFREFVLLTFHVMMPRFFPYSLPGKSSSLTFYGNSTSPLPVLPSVPQLMFSV